MIMSPQEARSRWCPFARDTDENMGSFNRLTGGGIPPDCQCLADQCMAWRWTGPDMSGGFCGLAGTAAV